MELHIDEKVINKTYLPYLFEYKPKVQVFFGGAGSGKSHFVAQKIVLKCLRQKRKVLIIRSIGATIKDSVWQMILDTLSFFRVYDKCTINKSEFSIELPNGSQLLFKGLQDEERIKSIAGITDCWIEEASEITANQYAQLKLRVRAKTPDNNFFLSYNPISKSNWVYEEFHKEDTRDQEAFVLKTTYLDNDFLPDDYIKSLEDMKRTNPYHYQVYALGEFGALGKAIYSNWRTDKVDVETLLKRNLELCCGIDVGFNHPYAICLSLVDRENRLIYVFDEWYRKGVTNEDAYRWICENGYSSNTFICDSASPRDIETLRRMGLRVKGAKKGHGSIRNGITNIQTYNVVIDESCTNFISEITGYSWAKDREGNYIEEPLQVQDDLMDAWRYSLEDIVGRKSRVQFFNIRM